MVFSVINLQMTNVPMILIKKIEYSFKIFGNKVEVLPVLISVIITYDIHHSYVTVLLLSCNH